MNIQFRRKPDKEEAALAYDFFRNNKNRIIGVLVGIAVLIIFFNLYRSSYESNKMLAADKLFEISMAYQNSDYDHVIEKGSGYVDKFSGFDPAGDILIIVAKTQIRLNNTDQAIDLLEKNQKVSKNPTFRFALYNLLGGLYMDKWLIEKNPALAEKSGEYYLKAAESDRGIHRERTLYNAGNSFVQAGNNSKAKKALKPIYDNSLQLEYQLREKVRFLYDNID